MSGRLVSVIANCPVRKVELRYVGAHLFNDIVRCFPSACFPNKKRGRGGIRVIQPSVLHSEEYMVHSEDEPRKNENACRHYAL